MRYFSYNEYDPGHPLPDDTGGYVRTLSEEDIRREYYPYWYKKMCEKYGQERVDNDYTFEDFLADWIIVHWAWEVQE
jgi:hypothetical protein